MAAPKSAYLLLFAVSLLVLADSGIAASGKWETILEFGKKVVEAADEGFKFCMKSDDCLTTWKEATKKKEITLLFNKLQAAKSRKVHGESWAGGELTQYKFTIYARDGKATGVDARCRYKISFWYIVEEKTVNHASIRKICS